MHGVPTVCALQVCVAGWSMGGIHACMVAALTRFPVAVAAMLPPRCASTAYCDGALSEFVDLAALRSGRDMHGAAILSTAAATLTPQPNYPNSAAIFRGLPVCELPPPAGAAREAAQRSWSSTDVHAWSRECTPLPLLRLPEDACNAPAAHDLLPPLHANWAGAPAAVAASLASVSAQLMHADCVLTERVHADGVASANGDAKALGRHAYANLLQPLPAGSLLAPHLRRFVASLSALTSPLWHSSTQRLRLRLRHRASGPRPPARAVPRASAAAQARLRPLAAVRAATAHRRRTAASAAAPSLGRRPAPPLQPALLRLQHALAALRQIALLRTWRRHRVRPQAAAQAHSRPSPRHLSHALPACRCTGRWGRRRTPKHL
jgi:Alpha/beta hydrolase domain containing 18